jgi:GNAT superfamily N-acetyltransferase
MTVTLPDLDAITRLLPRGYRARAFREEDREPLTEERNADLPEVERETAAEWREWEHMMVDPTQVRVIVESADDEIVAMLNVSNGGPFRAPDGSAHGSVQVARAHRGRGIGGAVVPVLEDEARRLGAPKLYARVSAREPESLAFAQRRGYKEVGRRIQAAIDLDAFDPAKWSERARRPREQGIAFETLADLRGAMTVDRFEALLHEVYDVEAEAWADVPIATPFPHWSFDVFRQLTLEHPGNALDLDVLALDGEKVVGLTTSYRSQGGKKGGTGFTGTLRSYRGRGIAFALKVDALTRAKATGVRWMLTTNDEPNKAMRGINYALGYVPLPASIQLEKPLA